MRRRHLCCLLFLLALVVSCGAKKEAGSVPQLSQGQIIVGGLDWVEIGDLVESSRIKEWSLPVADIDLPVMGSRCTGFLISEDILMTNQHCIPAASYARGLTVTFDHVKGVSSSQQERFDCSEFIGNDETLDYALLRCSGSPGTVYGFVSLDAGAYSAGQQITVIQQNCDYYSTRNCDWTKKYSQGQITAVANEYTHNADTLGGSSGSPVFDSSSGRVLAIHHAGLGNNGAGRGIENYAVPMSKIVAHIKSRFPAVFGGADSGEDRVDPAGAGDDKASALVLSKNKVTLSERVGVAGDKDYFKVKLAANESAVVSVSFSHAAGDLDLKVYSASGSVVAKSEGTTGQERVEFKGSGTFYILVYGYRDAVADYEFNFAKSSSGAATSSELVDGDNDSAQSAALFSHPASGDDLEIESASDQDYYGFELKSGDEIDVELKLDHSAGDLDLYLLDASLKILAKSESTTDLESFRYRISTSGKYFVVVKGYKGATGRYQLSTK